MKPARLLAGTTALGCLVLATAGSTGALAATPPTAKSSGPVVMKSAGPLKQIPGRPTLTHAAMSTAAALSTKSVTSWTHTVNDGGTNLTYAMVGKDPTVLQAAPGASIKTQLVPVIVKFSNGHTWDPTVGDSCDTTSALTRTVASPIFKGKTYSLGGTAVGKGQYTDVFQRANYYEYTKPTGINPGYHVKLGLSVLPAVTINVPDADAAEYATGCGNGVLAAVDIDWLDNYLQTTLIPSLAPQGVTVKTFPLFLLGNVIEYIGTPGNCCVLGYHNALQTAAGVQTYSIAMYDNSGDFSGSQDISVLTHEVGEWMDDPFVNNPTKPWGNIGQVSGCQNNLEVGDPLSGTLQPITLGGHVFHAQELAFTSWFYHQAPSTGVNGWYSNYGTFTSPAAVC